ncbi:S1/P1 nuclease [Bradyrhizobium septentrionale]|uniref:S1/P1 nuclease n=1 Tax=Bradyrhizobium septentrionale TaxID=1404411 RepID=A0A973W8Q9_9BRAD|nr:S1/P1 nuclease [Bradyrhizobium septentrionale]UGY17971.1 S1/P1 nuclease [Bradyrhizobium septentrionale]
MKVNALLPFVICLVFAGEAHAWNLRGHMEIAAVAWDQLKPATKAKVSQLLRLNPAYDDWVEGFSSREKSKAAFTRAAGWPDDIKRDHDYTNDGETPSGPDSARNIGYQDKLMHRYWHYKDIPFSPDGTPTHDSPVPNAETQIIAFRDALASHDTPDDVKSYDLVWLLHLVGDVHQPLHATSRFTHDLPDGDRGGNSVKLCESPCRNELHAFWDNLFGTGTSTRAAINAARKLDDAPDGAATNQDVRSWIVESFELAKSNVYQSPIGIGDGPFTISDTYRRKAKTLANERASIAGARLAKLLNDALQ